MNRNSEKAADQGKYIRALVLAGFDVSLTKDHLLVIHSKHGFEGKWETAKTAWYDIKESEALRSA